ncbi:ATP-binding protein [Candidatus Magnetominusculus dajiuhuensis]|uniref:ATP-binding response regulator n=1 Tax=Candidatus Magnetominusculus dajiuhuensis TaxID=3137712 RepID=UPI003B42CB28
MNKSNEIALLVVDDDQDIRSLFELHMPNLGYRVTTASSGDEAIGLIGRVNPQLVLLDQEMPGSDGLSTFLKIKRRWPDLPVVMCSGHGSIELVRVFMLKGGQDFIEKPIYDMEILDFRLRKILWDIASERRLREDLIAACCKSDSDSFKSMMIASMSHELRTPLNHLMGFSQMLSTGSEQPTVLSQKIIEAAERLNTVVDKIMVAATIDDKLDLSTFSLSDLIQELCGGFEKRLKSKGVYFKRNVTALSVNADYKKLRTVIGNLIENAIKFTESGGYITCSVVEVGGRVVISISDTGIGIAGEDLGGIFERFGKVDHKTGERQGMGMGLYIAKRLVDVMGGELDVISELGKGSVFSISL